MKEIARRETIVYERVGWVQVSVFSVQFKADLEFDHEVESC